MNPVLFAPAEASAFVRSGDWRALFAPEQIIETPRGELASYLTTLAAMYPPRVSRLSGEEQDARDRAAESEYAHGRGGWRAMFG